MKVRRENPLFQVKMKDTVKAYSHLLII